MQKLKRNANLIVIVAILFVTGISFASVFRSQANPLVSIVSADEDEENDDEDDKEDESDGNRDEDEEKENEDESDREDEDENENKDEDEPEKSVTRVRTSTQTTIRTQTVADKEDDEDEDEDENEDEDNVSESKEDIAELKKDIQKVELRMNVLSANGISVDAFKNSLAEISSLVSQAESVAVSNPKSVEEILEIAEHKLERIEKLVKMSLKDDDEDEESIEEATEEIGELKRDIAKIETRLNAASANGFDVSSYQAIISDAKTMLGQAESKLSAGFYVEAEALAELAGKKLDRIDDLFEDDEDEDEISDEYRSEVALFVHNLKAIGEIDGGIGQQVNVVAQAQNDSQTKVEDAIADAGDRSSFVKFLIGPKYGSITEIQTAITENQTRIKVLSDLAGQMTDPAVKQVLQDQIAILAQQNANLQKFITETESGISLFGWLVKMFS